MRRRGRARGGAVELLECSQKIFIFFPFSLKVDYVAGKVFFTADAEPSELKKIKSGERLFLLIKKHGPLPVSGHKGSVLTSSPCKIHI